MLNDALENQKASWLKHLWGPRIDVSQKNATGTQLNADSVVLMIV